MYYNDINGYLKTTSQFISYQKILANFGVRVDKLDASEYRLIAYNMMDLIKLEYLNEKIVLITFLALSSKIGYRQLIDVDNILTLNLIGCKRGLFGVKAVVFNRNTL